MVLQPDRDCADSWQPFPQQLAHPNKTRCKFVCFEWSFMPLRQRKPSHTSWGGRHDESGGLTYTSPTCSIDTIPETGFIFKKKKGATHGCCFLRRSSGLGLDTVYW